MDVACICLAVVVPNGSFRSSLTNFCWIIDTINGFALSSARLYMATLGPGGGGWGFLTVVVRNCPGHLRRSEDKFPIALQN